MRNLSYLDFWQTLGADQGDALVMFGGPRCGACKAMIKALHIYRQEHPLMAVYEVNAEDNPGLVAEFGFFHLPAMYLFVAGQYHRALDCEPRVADIHRAVEEARKLPAEEAP